MTTSRFSGHSLQNEIKIPQVIACDFYQNEKNLWAKFTEMTEADPVGVCGLHEKECSGCSAEQ